MGVAEFDEFVKHAAMAFTGLSAVLIIVGRTIWRWLKRRRR